MQVDEVRIFCLRNSSTMYGRFVTLVSILFVKVGDDVSVEVDDDDGGVEVDDSDGGVEVDDGGVEVDDGDGNN